MIQATTTTQSKPYQVSVRSGSYQFISDTTAEHGGGGEGFRPHDLLEAALGACTAMTVRIAAEKHGIPLQEVQVTVTLDRSEPGQTIFKDKVTLIGDLTDEQKQRLLGAAKACPVRKTLMRQISVVQE